jgi:hypothetical protein
MVDACSSLGIMGAYSNRGRAGDVERNESNFGRVRAMARDLRDKATGLAEAFRSRNLSSGASKAELLGKRIDNVCALADKLGSSAPGKDMSTLNKIDAEWSIVSRLSENLQGPVAVRHAVVDFKEETQLLEDYLQQLRG